jgi:hypothetical protein
VIFELWNAITIGLLSLILTILSSKGQLFDNRKRWYKRLSKRGAVVIFFGLIIVFLSAVQYWKIDKRNSEKDELILELQRMLKNEAKLKKDSDLKYLRTSLREYDGLVSVYSIHLFNLMNSFKNPMSHERLELEDEHFRNRWNELAMAGNRILASTLVSGSNDLYDQWQMLNTEVFVILQFCLIPNGEMYHETTSSYEVTLEMKRKKLNSLNKRFQDDVNSEHGVIASLVKKERDKIK